MVCDLYEVESIQNFKQQLTDVFNHRVEVLEIELVQLTDFLILKGMVLQDNPHDMYSGAN